MKTIVITGAANGLGSAIAHRYKNERCILIDRDEAALKQVASELDMMYFIADIGDVESIQQLILQLNKEIDHIDVLINNAGLWISGPVSQMNQSKSKLNTYDYIHDVLNTNVFGMIAMIKGLFESLKNGIIININSQSGVVVEKEYPIYNASKHATKAFTRAIQDDLAAHQIRITDIHPGLINTAFYDHANDPLPPSILELGLDVNHIVDLVDYLLNLPPNISLPSIEIKDMRSF